MYMVRTKSLLHKPKFFIFKLRLVRHTDHENGTPSLAKTPRLYYSEMHNLNQLNSPLFIHRHVYGTRAVICI